jgi:hypothetical protein
MEDYFKSGKNPFLVDIDEKDEYTNEDLESIQKQLRDKKLDEFINYLYPKDRPFHIPFELISQRVKRGITATLIDTSSNNLPSKNLYKIGNGGDKNNCIVCCSTSLSSERTCMTKNIKESLEKVGFNGYFYLFTGGFPNPTNTELKYAGVPYCFKIFMMLEAKKLGFNKVIWIDAACYVVNNPEPLFDLLDENDVVFRSFPSNMFDSFNDTVFPQTIELLNKLTNKDIRNDRKINTIVFGLKLNSEKIQKFIEEYYEMVKIGLPFLSYFPEEVVFGSILNKPEYKYVFNNSGKMERLYIHENYSGIEHAKNCGYYFQQRQYRTE